MIYAIVNTKGGVGKTTVAVHLATHLARQGSTLLIDGDVQASAASWATWRREASLSTPSPTTVSLLGASIGAEGPHLAGNFDHMVIDVGGMDSAGLRCAVLLADRAIIPVGASQLDAAALADILQVISDATVLKPTTRALVLLNRINAQTKDTADMLDYLRKKGLTILDTALAERVAYRRAVGEGMAVWEYGRDKLADKEVAAAMDEITR